MNTSAFLRPLRLDRLIRVSVQDGREGDSFRSPGQQRGLCDTWARTNGAEIVFEHTAISGRNSAKTMARTDVDAAVARIRAGLTDGVVVAWLDRFSRAPVREALSVYQDIRDAGGRVIAVDMAGLNPDDATGEFALTVHLAVNRMVWRKTAERYAQSRREAIEDGKSIGRPTLGYRYADPTRKPHGPGVINSRLVVYEPERPVVLELFERKASGASWLQLARWLDVVMPKPAGRLWARSSVSDLIGRRVYLGEVHHGEFRNAGAHEAIVPVALWRRAQNVPGERTPRGAYLLSGRVRCAGCGRRMQAGKPGHLGDRRTCECRNRECPARSVVMVDLLDAEVLTCLWERLDAFHLAAVEDEEVETARTSVEDLTAALEMLAAVIPSHPVAVAAHQAALQEAEMALQTAEDRMRQLRGAREGNGTMTRELRDDWPNLALDEQREIIRAAVHVVLVRRATRPGPASRGTPRPIRERVLVLFRGEAPPELIDNGRNDGPMRSWAWNDEPGSLTVSA